MIYWKSSKIFKVQGSIVSLCIFYDEFQISEFLIVLHFLILFKTLPFVIGEHFVYVSRRKSWLGSLLTPFSAVPKLIFHGRMIIEKENRFSIFFLTKTFLRLSESETCSTARILSFHKNYEDKSQLFSDKNFIPEVIHYYSILTQFDTLNQAVSHLFLPYKLGVFLFFSFSNSFKIGHIWNKLVNFLS